MPGAYKLTFDATVWKELFANASDKLKAAAFQQQPQLEAEFADSNLQPGQPITLAGCVEQEQAQPLAQSEAPQAEAQPENVTETPADDSASGSKSRKGKRSTPGGGNQFVADAGTGD
jgi:hypothetical protein